MVIEPNLPIKDQKIETAAITQSKQAVESAGKAVKYAKEQLVKPKEGADSAKSSKAETGAAGKDSGDKDSGGKDSGAVDQAAIESGRGVRVNIET